MAQDINIKMTLTDGGSVDARVSDAKRLNKELEKTEATTERINKATSRSKSASAALDRAGPSASEVVDYNAQRGAAGAAGGTARDFAAQAQGLGGLVRLYATFAANIYAVSAAYTALDNAFKVEKMIESSQKFSAVVGISMRSVAKSLQEATQYSLSFQEAVKFANVGTAAGLAAKDIQNLTVIAKGAATALGRDVGESIQRIIQGTAKQEQEILDELGIFIKSKKAFEDYAEARNVKADDLTATQRTLAYAEAVAKAGEKWKEFSNIEDPFGKLNASMSNALTEVLNTINKVAAPLASFLADSTQGIIALGLAITALLTKKALPTLKDGLLSILTLDSSRAKATAEAMRTTIGGTLARLGEEAKKIDLRLEELSKTKIKLDDPGTAKTYTKGLIPKELTGRGGLSEAKLAAELFSDEDLGRFKKVEDINKAIDKSIQSQVANSQNKAKLIDAMIAKGTLEKGSNEANLIISQKAYMGSQQMLTSLQARNAELLESNALVTRLSEVEAEQLANRNKLNTLGGERKNIPTSADFVQTGQIAGKDAALARQVFKEATSQAQAMGQAVGTATANSVKGAGAMAASFTAVSASLQTARVAAAELGIAANFKLFGATLATMGSSVATLTSSMLGLGAATTAAGTAGAAAGTLIAAGMSAARMAVAGLLAALGPIMLAWSLWEIFGNKVKEVLGLYNEKVDEAQKKTKEASDTYKNTIADVSEAVLRADKVLNSTGIASSSEEIVKALEARANAYRSIAEAADTARLARAKEAQVKASEEENKGRAGTSKGVAFNKEQLASYTESQNIVKILKDLSANSPQALEALKKVTEAQADMNEVGETSYETSINIAEGHKKLKKAMEEAYEDMPGYARSAAKLDEELAALANRTKTGAQGLSSFLSGFSDIQKTVAKSKGFNSPEAMKASEQYLVGVKEIVEQKGKFTKSAQTSFDTLVAENQGYKDLADSLQAVKKPYAEVLAIYTALAKVDALRKKVASTDGDARSRARAAEELAIAEKEAQEVLRENNGAVVQGVNAIDRLKGSTEQYGTAAKQKFKEIEQQIKAAEAALKAMNATLGLNSKLLSLRSDYTGEKNLENNLAKDRLAILQKEFEIEANKARLARERVREAKETKGNKKAQEEADTAQFETLESLRLVKEQQTSLIAIEQIERSRNENLRQIEEKAKLAASAAERSLAVAKLQLDLDKAYGDARATALGLTKEEAQYEALLLDQQLKRLDAAARRAAIEREAKNEADRVTTSASSAIDAAKQTGQPESEINKLIEARDAKLKEISAEAQRKLDLDSQQLSAAEKLMEMDRNRLSLIAAQSSATQKLAKLSTSIVGAFKGTGMEKQAKALTDILKVSQSSAQKMAKVDEANKSRKEKNLDEIAKLTKKANEGDLKAMLEVSNMKVKSAEEDIRSTEERKEMELEATMESLSAFKSMFSEKTAAYKVLDGIERAMHVMRLAESAQQTAQMIADNAKRVASMIGVIAKDGISAVVKQGTDGDVYTAFARMAAMAAFVASLTGGSSKTPSIPGGVTAKDRQETQGTGMSWVNGKKVENGNGVFGDSEAKSESIKNSLELIAENTIEGLSFDRRMLNALESIDRAIGSAAKSIYGIQGLRKGSIGNTIEGTQSGSGFLGTGWLASKRSTDIIDSGITINGSISQLMQGINSTAIKFYETVQTTTKKWYGSTKTSISENVKAADAVILEQFANIFQNAEKVFIEAGKGLGKSVEDVKAQFGAISFSDFKFSARDLKGEDLEKELNSFISSALDTAAAQLFSSMKKYQEFGEGLLETVVRVTDANKKINLALSAIGNSSNQWANLTYDVTESIIDTFGGLDKFTESIEGFRKNFLTEAERIAPVAKAVTDEMNRLGYGFVDTRDEFKLLVQSLNLNIPAQRELYMSLMLVADSFAEVYESTSESLDANEYRNRLLEQEITILELLGKRTEAISLTRQKELEELEKLGVAQSTQLIYNQKVIWALEDALEVRSAEADLLGTLGRTYEQTLMQREEELRGLTDNLKVLKKAQFAAEDYNNTQSLMVELLRLEGKEKQATAIIRQGELKGLSQVDKAIKQTIYAMEDEAALREELKEARAEETSTLEDVISRTRDYIKSLKDYRASLLIGNLSILNPAQKYEEAKARALELAARASGPATTKEEIEARDNARSGLQSATSAWLEASRTLFASSEGYVTDFNKVLELLDQASVGASEQLSDAEKQLKAINDSIAVQNNINNNTKDTADLLRQLVESQKAAEQFKSSIPTNLETYYGLDKLDLSISSLASVLDAAVASIERPAVNPPPPDIGQQQAIVDSLRTTPQFTTNDTEALRRQVASLEAEIKGLREESRESTAVTVEAEHRSSIDNAERITSGLGDMFRELTWRLENERVTLR